MPIPVEEPNYSTDMLTVLEQRQDATVSHMRSYFTTIIIIAILFLIVTTSAQWYKNEIYQQVLTVEFLERITVNNVIVFVWTFFSNVLMLVFLIWSLTFIPNIVIQSHKSARIFKFDLGTKPSRWLQLYITTSTPAVLLAIVWVNFNRGNVIDPGFSISDFGQIKIIAISSFVVYFAMFAISKFIPLELVALRVTILYLILCSSSYINYGYGINNVSLGTLLGVIIYFMLNRKDIADMAQGIAVYDIDSKLAESLRKLGGNEFEAQIAEAEVENRMRESTIKHNQLVAEANAKSMAIKDATENERLDVAAQQQQLAGDITRELLQSQRTKVELITHLYKVFAERKLKSEQSFIQELINDLESNKNLLSDKDFEERMKTIVDTISGMSDIEENLKQLRQKVIESSKELDLRPRLNDDQKSS